jgi:hypothetical protein
LITAAGNASAEERAAALRSALDNVRNARDADTDPDPDLLEVARLLERYADLAR